LVPHFAEDQADLLKCRGLAASTAATSNVCSCFNDRLVDSRLPIVSPELALPAAWAGDRHLVGLAMFGSVSIGTRKKYHPRGIRRPSATAVF